MEKAKVKQISFKQDEFPLLIQHQKELQKLYRMDISGLYKYLLREKHQELFGSPTVHLYANQQVNP